mgnify:CR=1 FL=1
MKFYKKAKYLIRLDDACPTQKRENWEKIEEILKKYEIKPIVAVIPDCQDEKLKYEKPMEYFWEKIKEWKNNGWAIAMHGYQHLYFETKAFSFVPFHKKSEFVGLPYEIQAEKIKKAWEIFLKAKIKPKIWVAPSHSFDKNTLLVLKNYTEISIISDCFAFDVFFHEDFYFIPQQLWKFKLMPFGLWTICLHPNTMKEDEFEKLEFWLKKYKNFFIGFDEINFKKRKWSFFERFINDKIWFNKSLINFLKKIRKK